MCVDTYSAERCSCGAPAAVVVLDDHGYVHAAACRSHRGATISTAITPALYVIEVVEAEVVDHAA